MKLDTVVPQLFREFPDLKATSAKVLSDYGEETPGPYSVFGDVLLPATYAALDRGDEAAARRYFGFYERVASDPDEDVQALTGIELIEDLANDPVRLRQAWPYLGPSTRKEARDYAAAVKRQVGREIWLPEQK